MTSTYNEDESDETEVSAARKTTAIVAGFAVAVVITGVAGLLSDKLSKKVRDAIMNEDEEDE